MILWYAAGAVFIVWNVFQSSGVDFRAVAVGALWEIFEFAVDRLFGTTMQKPMLGDASGLTDTMWDLIVDTLGALVISVFGWWHMKRNQRSFVDVWIDRFIERNPRLFRG